MCEYCELCVAAIRLVCYQIYKFICCVKDKPPTATADVICLGLSQAGKSTVLSTLCKEDSPVQPTIGFSIKALHLSTCILNVKEIGGSDHVRPFWSKYYQKAQGLIFAVDGSAELDLAKREFHAALNHPLISGLPLLLLITHTDCPESRSEDEITEFLEIHQILSKDSFIVHSCASTDYQSLLHGFTRYSQLVCQ